MLRRRCDRTFGLGPLFFDGEGGSGEGAGDGGAAGGNAGGAPGGGAGSGAPAPAPSGQGGEDRSGWIPRDRFDSVNGELATLRREKEEREAKELADKGEHQKLAESEKAKREAAEARATTIARRSAFVAAASGKVTDPEAAYKLAQADGLLSDLGVDDDGNAKDPKQPAAIVESVLKAYEFLKVKNGTGRDFGGPAGGNQPGGKDRRDMTGMDMLQAGYAERSSR